MTITRLIVVAAVAWIAALAGLIWMMALAGMNAGHALTSFAYMDPVVQICVVLACVATVIGVVSVRTGQRSRARICAAASFGWGVLGAVYWAPHVENGLINMNPPIPFYIYAPGYAEVFITLLVGLTGAILCLTALRLQKG